MWRLREKIFANPFLQPGQISLLIWLKTCLVNCSGTCVHPFQRHLAIPCGSIFVSPWYTRRCSRSWNPLMFSGSNLPHSSGMSSESERVGLCRPESHLQGLLLYWLSSPVNTMSFLVFSVVLGCWCSNFLRWILSSSSAEHFLFLFLSIFLRETMRINRRYNK